MKILFDFENKSHKGHWYSINDVIMGGRSVGKIELKDRLIFSGRVSFENSGGFASIRSEAVKFDLSSFKGIALRVKGDNKKYKLNLRDEESNSSINFQQKFFADDNWNDIFLPFKNFEANLRGRKIAGADLDLSKIISLGFLISDKQEGEFELLIKSISAY